jgi:hypothetical protein
MESKKDVRIKMPDDLVGGRYANQMVVQHTREEFVLDFLSVFPPGGTVHARVVVSPAHVKRMISALADNVRKYEAQFGAIEEPTGPEPPPDPYAEN